MVNDVRDSSGNRVSFAAVTTDFALVGSQALYKLTQSAGLNTSWHDTPGPHYYLIWGVFLGDFGSMCSDKT